MRVYRLSLILAVSLVSVTAAQGEPNPQESLPEPPASLEIEVLGGVNDEFIKQVAEILQKIPPHLTRQVAEAEVSVLVAQDLSFVESLSQESLREHAAVYESEPSRKRIVINRSHFTEVEGSYYRVSKDATPTDRDLGSVVAHEFGHAYDWAPTYDKDGSFYPNRVRSNASQFVSAFNIDQKRAVVPHSNVEEQARPYAHYLNHFRGTGESNHGTSPDPLREAYAEAIAIHLALFLDYHPQKSQRFFRHSFPNVVEQVRREVFPQQELAREDISQVMQQPGLLQSATQPIPAQEVEFAEATSFNSPIPNIASVHEFDHPPLANISGESIRIRVTRFEVDVDGLDRATEYKLLVCFDGETIGETDWFVGRDSYAIPTQVGFPPGRYRLTVQAFRRHPFGSAVQTSAVLINYQPTYLREMQHVRGRDVTAVTSHLAVSHRPLEDDGPSQPVQVRFVGLDNWNVYTYSADAKRFELEPHVIPRRRSFTQGRAYQLKIKHDAAELYPTLEIPRTSPQTTAFLAHSSVAVELKQPEIDYVRSGGMLTKVMYLPNRTKHATGANCIETKVSRCPGDCQDPLAEAAREGTILAILRLGERDLE